MAGESILVVDDNAVNLKLARVLLVSEGYRVHTAGDAKEALRLIDEASPQMVLMDLQLPGISGLQLTRLLKSDQRRRAIPIIALTAFAMKGDAEMALAAGCDGYVSKPIDIQRLTSLIAELFKKGPAKA